MRNYLILAFVVITISVTTTMHAAENISIPIEVFESGRLGEYENWWAAEHIHGEPNAEPGKSQHTTADLNIGLKVNGEKFTPGTYYFAMRCWSKKNHRSEISNQVKVKIK